MTRTDVLTQRCISCGRYSGQNTVVPSLPPRRKRWIERRDKSTVGPSGWIQHGLGRLHPIGPAEPQAEELHHQVNDYDRVEFYGQHTG